MIDGHWLSVRDGDPRAAYLFQDHYSKYHYKDNRKTYRFVGPGEYIALMTVTCDALFVWRHDTRPRWDHQEGVCCSIFRNTGPILSSVLIQEASQIAETQWPAMRQFTFINPRAIISSNPGYCFLVAGWRRCGHTQTRDFLILERVPHAT